MKMLSVDPGGVTGWALWEDAKLHSFGSIVAKNEDFSEYFTWIHGLPVEIKTIVCESYIIRPVQHGGFDHSFNKGSTLQLIGALKYKSYLMNCEFVLQSPSIKVPASGMAFRSVYKKGQKDNQHHYDAVLHGAYYLITKKKFKREDLG